jgi:hypothetical protein
MSNPLTDRSYDQAAYERLRDLALCWASLEATFERTLSADSGTAPDTMDKLSAARQAFLDELSAAFPA